MKKYFTRLFISLKFGFLFLASGIYQVSKAQTIFQPGDLAIIGYYAQLGTNCGSGYSSDDLIGFVTFVDITNGTKIIFTDKGYISGTGNFRSSEGAAEYTRTGGTITKGSTFYIAFGDAPGVCGSGVSSCSNGWTAVMAPGTTAVLSNLDLNSTSGDQVFIMQGAWSSDTQFNGTYLYGLTTTNTWTYGAGSASSSNLPASLNCLNMRTSNVLNSVYNGTGFNAAQFKSEHITNIYNTANWNNVAPTISPACPTTSNFTFSNFSTITISPNLTDITICESQSGVVLSATGTGAWTTLTSTGTIATPTQAVTSVTGLNLGDNIFRWSASNCSDIFEVKITRTPLLTPTISLTSTAPSNSICTGASVSLGAAAANLGGGTASYNFLVNGISAQNNATSIFATNTLQNGQNISVVLSISGGSCLSTRTVTSNSIVMTVNPYVAPTILISPNTVNICAAQPITFTTSGSNLGSPTYRWNKNGTIIGTNTSSYTDNNLQTSDAISVTITATGACLSTITAFNQVNSIVVNPNLTPAISIVGSVLNNIICAGVVVTFTGLPTNGGNNTTYKWYKNTTLVGSNSSNYVDNSLANGDIISIQMISNAICPTLTTVSGNTIPMTVNGNPLPSVTLVGINNAICAGSNASLSTVAANTGSGFPVYTFKLDDNIVQSGILAIYTTTSLLNNSRLNVEMSVGGTNCFGNVLTATSKIITASVLNNSTPTVTISSSLIAPICEGTQVVLTATGGNYGSAIATYLFKINNTLVQRGTSFRYATSNLTDGQLLTVDLSVSGGNCLTSSTATSNVITAKVNPNLLPTITITGLFVNPVCEGTTISFTSLGNNLGNTPSYLWLKNGYSIGINSSTFSDNTIVNADQIKLQVISSENCTSQNSNTSNTITIETKNCEVPIAETLFIPDLFSPNNDNKNDAFIITANTIAEINLRVYSRAGNLVYATTNISDAISTGWDGKTNGIEQPSGSYLWQLSGKLINGKELEYQSKKQGIIQLLR